ncbi:EH signature domain-containing protein [Shewanella xiamenensis]|uniref:EH signature domain-containing protein n=1 Tax=Shewanella xiamenensis TaxID=332186 RepID=UPI0035BA65CF
MAINRYSFTLPNLPRSNRLDRLVFDDWYDMGLFDEQLPSFPPKTLEQIVTLVLLNRSQEIHIFEWLDVLENQSQWDDLPDEMLERACIAVWSGIACNQTLGDVALFKIGLALDGKTTNIASQIIDSMEIARSVPQLDDLLKYKIDWLLLLQRQDFYQLAQYCYKLNRTISGAVKWLRLPQMNSYETQLLSHLCAVSVQQQDDKSDQWLAANFLALQATSHRIEILDQYIQTFGKVSFGKRCGKLIEQHCFPEQTNSYWGRLSISSQALLKTRFKLSNYYNLSSISSVLCSEEAGNVLGFLEDERRQIRSRSKFWSNYSSRFNRVRVLLPEQTFKFVSEINNALPIFINQIKQMDRTESEIFVFELEKIIVVEFLRGGMAETRFFNRNDWNSQRLFESAELNGEDIRAMSQLEVHDHLVGWQHFCEKLLRTKFNLLPNDGLTKFRGLPPEANGFSSAVGLPKPPANMLMERQKSLESWVERFWSVELQTGKFGYEQKKHTQSQTYMAKAFVSKQMGEQLEFEKNIKLAAEHGNSEAMWQLGKLLLLDTRSDSRTKKLGEKWIAKAAGLEHPDALATCKRYGFEPILNQQVGRSVVADDSSLKSAQCVELLRGIREFDQKKGIELANNLAVIDGDNKQIHTALLGLASRTKSVEIRKQVAEVIKRLNNDELIWQLASEFSLGKETEQEEAIRMLSELYKKGVRDTKFEIRKIVNFATDYRRKKVQFFGLEELTKFGDVDAPYELYLLVREGNDKDSKQLADRLLMLAEKRGNKEAKAALN